MMNTALFTLLLCVSAACDDFGPLTGQKENGTLTWSLDKDFLTKTADEEIPDIGDFLLSILDSDGNVLYNGTYGNSPESLEVEPGSYTLSIRSVAFTSPAFARPQYGDDKVVVVESGQTVNVKLECTLTNCGMRLIISPDFLDAYPGGVMYLKQDNVRLKYVYNEKRIAYFLPGKVSIILYDSGKDETLATKTLQAREILTMGISVAKKSSGASIEVSIDTTKMWLTGNYTIGGGGNPGGGADISDAISVNEAGAYIDEKGIWVQGYIVGGDLTTNGASVKTTGITKNTHFAIADRASVTTKSSCLAVELPSGSVRDALNLVDHPDLIGKKVFLKGNIVEKYYGTKGMKGTSDFELR